jgi:hypothetical protein
MHRLACRDPVGPRSHPARITQRRKLSRNLPKRFLENVFREIRIVDNRANVLEERLLQRAKKLIERLPITRLRAGDDKYFLSAR